MSSNSVRSPLGSCLAALLAASLVACGGGGGGTGSAAAAPAAPAATSGDAAAPMSVQGTVTGFASVIIDGVEYDDSAASVQVERNPAVPVGAALGDLRIGMRVAARASGGKLSEVTVHAALAGPVTAVDAAAGTFTVLQQPVRVLPATDVSPTVYSGATGLAAISIGDMLEVHGSLDADKVLVATRVERKPRGDLGHGVHDFS